MGESKDVPRDEFARTRDELHQQIGRFVVEFEEASFWLRDGIRQMLHNDGLRTEDLSDILLENRFTSAAYVCDTFFSMAAAIQLEKNEGANDVLGQLKTISNYLLPIRNNVVHGYWYVAFDGNLDTYPLTIGGIKGHPSRTDGMKFKSILKGDKQGMEGLVELADKAHRFKELAIQVRKYCALPR